MPYKAKHNCAYSGCLVEVTGRYCDRHKKQTVSQSQSSSEDRKHYKTTDWQARREQQLIDEPFCEAILDDGIRCNAIATDVDHKTARNNGGTDEPSNLQSLCHSCHSRKTARFDMKRQNGRFASKAASVAILVLSALSNGDTTHDTALRNPETPKPAQGGGWVGFTGSRAPGNAGVPPKACPQNLLGGMPGGDTSEALLWRRRRRKPVSIADYYTVIVSAQPAGTKNNAGVSNFSMMGSCFSTCRSASDDTSVRSALNAVA
ncbi:MAG: HNH endonuclease [Candidatus Melainabacteria bacterium]|nr:MAG: HNH endonuclease [Candidatus Melainabacteria bacterium]